jgi:hypothetical protein
MTTVDEYHAKANEFLAKAAREIDPLLRSEYQQLGQGYLRLAEQAERNLRSDIVYQTPSRPAAQQQQQIQPRKADD